MRHLALAVPVAAITAAAALFLSSPASAQSVTEPEQCDYNERIGKMESGGNDKIVNEFGYAGKFQMGKAALIEAGYRRKDGSWTGVNGITSMEQFLASPAAQADAMQRYTNAQLGYLKNLGVLGSIGQSAPGCGVAVTQGGILAGAHLVGPGGMKSFFKSGGFCGKAGQVAPNGYRLEYSTTDGYNTCAKKYVCALSGCQDIQKDMSKKTCEVTMPMIEGISCSNFSPSLQGFCQTYRPYLMTRGECNSAEEMAEGARKGPNKEQCENLSFGVGTGSWSFVLACSWAGDFVADQDGKSNPNGPVSDPACIENLRGMGVDFDVLGQVNNGSYGGRTCTIENAVSLRGTAVPFGAKLTMTCDMAIAMEKWGQQLKGIGVTGYYGIGSTRECGPMRDKNGNKPGTITEHALGRAVDVSGVIVGGRKVSMGAIHAPITPDGVIAVQAKQLACGTFRGVLSPTYAGYIGTFVHFHVEWGKFNGCR